LAAPGAAASDVATHASVNIRPHEHIRELFVGLRLNLGCGRSPLEGWVNVDITALPGVDVVADLDACRTQPLPFADDSVSAMRMSHVLEHMRDTLALLQDLHRVAEPGCQLTILCPYGSSDDAYEDPTHCQRFYMNSFSYFGTAGVLARGLRLSRGLGSRGHRAAPAATGKREPDRRQVLVRVRQLRNVVIEMGVVLKAVKPIRPADRALLTSPMVKFQLV
jgi:hypothetical protein